MILEIIDVRFDRESLDFRVAGKVGTQTCEVPVSRATVSRQLEARGVTGNLSKYEMRDLAPFVAQLATHDLSEAFTRQQ